MRDKTPKSLVPIIIALVVAISVSTGVIWSQKTDTPPVKQAATSQNNSTAKSNIITYDGVEGKTALELLKAKATVVTQQSNYGEYVDSINGVKGGTDKKYWAFYVNGQLAQVGAADYATKNGDTITWKFE